jgi:hypothetical protein
MLANLNKKAKKYREEMHNSRLSEIEGSAARLKRKSSMVENRMYGVSFE